MVINVQSWVIVLDFFGLADDQIISTQPSGYSKPVSRRQSDFSDLPVNESEIHCMFFFSIFRLIEICYLIN